MLYRLATHRAEFLPGLLIRWMDLTVFLTPLVLKNVGKSGFSIEFKAHLTDSSKLWYSIVFMLKFNAGVTISVWRRLSTKGETN